MRLIYLNVRVFKYTRPFGLSVVDESFTFKIYDGTLYSSVYRVTLKPNQGLPPTASAATLTTDEDTDLAFSLNQYFVTGSGAPLYAAVGTLSLYLTGIRLICNIFNPLNYLFFHS